MPSRVEDHRAKAIECERRAETAGDPGVRKAYRRVAAQWSNMANQVEVSSPLAISSTRRRVLLTELVEGQEATVLQLPAQPKTPAEEVAQGASLTWADVRRSSGIKQRAVGFAGGSATDFVA